MIPNTPQYRVQLEQRELPHYMHSMTQGELLVACAGYFSQGVLLYWSNANAMDTSHVLQHTVSETMNLVRETTLLAVEQLMGIMYRQAMRKYPVLQYSETPQQRAVTLATVKAAYAMLITEVIRMATSGAVLFEWSTRQHHGGSGGGGGGDSPVVTELAQMLHASLTNVHGIFTSYAHVYDNPGMPSSTHYMASFLLDLAVRIVPSLARLTSGDVTGSDTGANDVRNTLALNGAVTVAIRALLDSRYYSILPNFTPANVKLMGMMQVRRTSGAKRPAVDPRRPPAKRVESIAFDSAGSDSSSSSNSTPQPTATFGLPPFPYEPQTPGTEWATSLMSVTPTTPLSQPSDAVGAIISQSAQDTLHYDFSVSRP